MSFLGTILLLPTDKTNDPVAWYVVDGQQRLTTFFFFFHYLKLRGSEEMLPRAMADTGWLKSEINGGQEQLAIDAAMALSFEDVKIERFPNDNNRYAYRLYLIGREFEDLWDDEFESLSAEERTEGKAAELLSDKALRDFLQYLGSEVSVVRIVTETGLAKTLDIFDTINTTGMALNGSDIFKIRMYEYLKDVKDWTEEDEPFKHIDALYAKLESENKSYALKGHDPYARICDMDQVLMLYQHALIEVESINRATHGLAASTFWDRLFRTILFNEQVEGFRRDAPYRDKIDLDAMTRLIEARFAWETPAVRTPRTLLMSRLMFYTRYGWRFWWLAVLYIDRFDGHKEGSGFDPKLLERFVELLTKYYAIQSIKFAKVVNASITFTYDLIKIMLDPNETQQGLLWHLENGIKNAAEDRLRGWLAENLYWNYLLCRLVCTLAEFSNPLADLETDEGAKHFHENVFDGEFDLDHIFANAQFEALPDVDRAQWNDLQNSIGNLTLFGRSENRSQGAYLYHEKRDNFHGSKYLSAREVGAHEAWTVEACAARRDLLVERVAGWLMG